MLYLLDANVLIQAKNVYYRFETFPVFWDWLIAEQARGRLDTIAPVYDELTRGTDTLADWMKDRKDDGWFLKIDDDATQMKFAAIADWLMAQPFTDGARAEFLGGADPWLIAKAATEGGIVVTLEKNDPARRNKVLIPVVCRAFGIPCVDTFAMMQRLGAAFGA